MQAIIFDCDGVIVDTERDGHRVAFNKAFAAKGYTYEWDVIQYKELLKIAGGKERMRYYFDQIGWPPDVIDREAFIMALHQLKTNIFMKIIESKELPLRPGIARLIDEAIAEGIELAVCSTSNERAVNLVLEKMLGIERKNKFKVILAGDVVSNKKPDPEIYNLALKLLNYHPTECMVVEDSRNGFLAAKAAGIPCLVTTNLYTVEEDFSGATWVVPELGNPPNIYITIQMLKDRLK